MGMFEHTTNDDASHKTLEPSKTGDFPSPHEIKQFSNEIAMRKESIKDFTTKISELEPTPVII